MQLLGVQPSNVHVDGEVADSIFYDSTTQGFVGVSVNVRILSPQYTGVTSITATLLNLFSPSGYNASNYTTWPNSSSVVAQTFTNLGIPNIQYMHDPPLVGCVYAAKPETSSVSVIAHVSGASMRNINKYHTDTLRMIVGEYMAQHYASEGFVGGSCEVSAQTQGRLVEGSNVVFSFHAEKADVAASNAAMFSSVISEYSSNLVDFMNTHGAAGTSDISLVNSRRSLAAARKIRVFH